MSAACTSAWSDRGGQRGAERAGAAAQVHHDRLRVRASATAWPDQELGAAARDEHGGIDGDPQAAELGPAQHVLEGLARGPPVHQGGQVGRSCGRRR